MPRLLAEVDFVREIAPILQRRCLSCHNDQESKGDFSLHTAASAKEDGYVVAGDAMASHLLEVISLHAGKARMPKNSDPLKVEQVKLIRMWIDEGAKWPADVELTESRVSDFNWWSYQAIRRPAVPKLENEGRAPTTDTFSGVCCTSHLLHT